MNERKCIVSGQSGSTDELVRFVCAPDGTIVPDLKGKLPGRGCWVTATRDSVEKAAAKGLFARALKRPANVDKDLPDLVDALMSEAALRSLAMARKAGMLTSGATQVDKAVRSAGAIAVLNAREAASDGVRKIDQARRATVHLGGPEIPAFELFTVEEMDLAFGDGNVIHAAVLDGGAGHAALQRLNALDRYRSGSRQ